MKVRITRTEDNSSFVIEANTTTELYNALVEHYGDEFDWLHDEFTEIELWDKKLTIGLLECGIDSSFYDEYGGKQLYTFTEEK